jgi:hypothetical protein
MYVSLAFGVILIALADKIDKVYPDIPTEIGWIIGSIAAVLFFVWVWRVDKKYEAVKK